MSVVVRDTFPDFLGTKAKHMPRKKRAKPPKQRPSKPSFASTSSYKSSGRLGKLSV